MSKVLTYSRQYPSYHSKRCCKTYFVEKFLQGLEEWYYKKTPLVILEALNKEVLWSKYHTIRKGKRFKIGDKFSPRVWSGKPYHSKQIIIYEDVVVKKVWDFTVKRDKISGDMAFFIGKRKKKLTSRQLDLIAKNDGLDTEDFLKWFQYPKPFKGQIICWNESIKY